MAKVLLFGATGKLGFEIAYVAARQGYELTAVIRRESQANLFKELLINTIVADVSQPGGLLGICNGYDVIISALGKNVSPNENSKSTFTEVDLNMNSLILNEAVKSNIKKFVYISAFHAEKYQHLEYFYVHHQFSERLKLSGIDYSIIKPPALFSGFLDMIDMAKKGRLVNIGKGDKKTNPIYEGDVAKICIESIDQQNITIECGGKQIYTRKQINELIQKVADPSKKLINFPLWLFKLVLPLVKIFAKNLFAKFSFFTAVLEEDTIAPQFGEMGFEEYLNRQILKQ
jgi:uncharacterized protein YbjT (DUF2867 family)